MIYRPILYLYLLYKNNIRKNMNLFKKRGNKNLTQNYK